MFHKLWTHKVTKFICVVTMGIFVALLTFTPYIYRYLTQGIVFSGSGDGYRQMMPFQMYLYDHFSHFKSFYDHSFGLGGDYVKDLAYYYATSPFTLVNFVFVWLSEHIFQSNPQNITFWASNQLIVAFVKGIATFVFAFYFFKYIKVKGYTLFLDAMLYAASTTVIYFNFTWSYYGDLLIFLPLSLLGIERFYREKKIGLFIFSIALTLFSNFYFSYYEAIVILAYAIYRFIWPHPEDVVTRKQQLWLIPTAVLLSTLIGIWGFYTGVSSFLNNDRISNPHFNIPMFTDFARQKHFFTNGFYITVSIIGIVALLSFQLYKHYYYRLFAIATWVMLIGSITPHFDSMFNGFSTPERRWVYIFAFTTAGLIALFIQHLAELSFKKYVYACIPTTLIMLVMTMIVKDQKMSWMSICLLLMITIGMLLNKKHLLNKKWVMTAILCLFIIQQGLILSNDHFNNVKKYESTQQAMSDSAYKSPALTKKIDTIQQQSTNPLQRIDYMSQYGLNSPMIYHFNGIALYSSIFDGDILKYYDKTLQINMHTDKNSTYRLLSNRANLMALWNVTDRIRRPDDLNMPYGFKEKDIVHHSKDEPFIHSKNQIHYPSAHITKKVFDARDLKSPLDREQAMLQGVVFNDDSHSANQHFSNNKNLLKNATPTLHDAHQNKNNEIIVSKDKGGISYHLPEAVAQKYKDMYVEMDVELLTPDKAHDVGVNEYSQQRNPLTYKYRRFVSPVTMRVKANKDLNIKLSKGTYRFKMKGIYGEDYQTLRKASKSLHPVKVSQQRDGYTITKDKGASGYVVLPMAYREGMTAYVDHETIPVQQGNGIMTVIPVEKGQEKIKLKYTPPHLGILITLTIIGILASVVFTFWLKRKNKT
ncbi:YfhO family protein [Staphylococcus caeli]|uniref:Integral membrane protein n=1 Tax=Staphylococcus caeli TaxID=2201815 RepID=A0A1D4MBZ8_9STAP|nr:YfhO family protein [Staphylococcus caeli]SCS95943.1 integral membrane protein [Staphylococcus caeli]SCT19823.1 integral membrane protein [Staphylococcus caeli]